MSSHLNGLSDRPVSRELVDEKVDSQHVDELRDNGEDLILETKYACTFV